MAYVIVGVEMDVVPTPEELEEARKWYIPTPEAPAPDQEWLLEEVALQRLDKVSGVEQLGVVESHA